MNKLKNKNGITLVALIITIIVLIILAGVTISIALGENGIFRKSKKAASEYQKSAKAEEEDDYQNWSSIDIDGNPNENLLKSGTMGSGYDKDQKFTVPENTDNIKWRVLSIEDGCVNLISETEIGRNGQWTVDWSDSLYLQDITGYAYGPQVLDQVCSIYGHGKGAKKGRSITVEDVNKISGYDPMKDDDDKDEYGQEYEWTVNGDDKRKYKWKNLYYKYYYAESGMNLKTEQKDSIPYKLIFDGILYNDNGNRIILLLASFSLCLC